MTVPLLRYGFIGVVWQLAKNKRAILASWLLTKSTKCINHWIDPKLKRQISKIDVLMLYESDCKSFSLWKMKNERLHMSRRNQKRVGKFILSRHTELVAYTQLKVHQIFVLTLLHYHYCYFPQVAHPFFLLLVILVPPSVYGNLTQTLWAFRCSKAFCLMTR